MESLSNTSFPVYKKDQVLSHIQLNESFNYLEEQTRITRTGLIATGIIDGLELKFINNTIIITRGVAVSSLGFQIQWDAKIYTHFHDITLSKEFLEPQIEENESLKNLLNKVAIYQVIKNCGELVEDTFTQAKSPITLASMLDKVVLLLIEMEVKNEDRCDANTCDENAANLKINIRPLLITKQQADALKAHQKSEAFLQLSGEAICMPRFNIPKSALTTRADITGAYASILNGQMIHKKLVELYEQTSVFFADINHINFLKTNKIKEIIETTKVSDYQYLYQWLLDITQTHHEILSVGRVYNRNFAIGSFPFHVVLGGIDATMNDNYRTDYFPTPILAKVEIDNYYKLSRLLQRLIHLLSSFKVKNDEIRITPSAYGNQSFDHKSIPFYYEKPAILSEVWSSKREPLGYNAKEYSTDDCVVNPLLYDLEQYNFYRIEGHLGGKYKDVIKTIENIKEVNRLPFKVVALNALDVRDSEIELNQLKISYKDLALNYNIESKKFVNLSTEIRKLYNKKEIKFNDLLLDANEISVIFGIINDVSNFLANNFSLFLDNYNLYVELSKTFKEKYSVFRSKFNGTTPSSEDFIDHVDLLHNFFIEDSFSVLYQEAYERYVESLRKTFFNHFYKFHAGIEPLNGVIKGGTFILVYADRSILKNPKGKVENQELKNLVENFKQLNFSKETQVVAQSEPSGAAISPSKIPAIGFSGLSKTAIEFDENVPLKLTKTLRDQFFSELKNKIKSEFPTDIKLEMDRSIRDIEEKFNKVDVIVPEYEGLIIADFCLPYICCGDGDAINIVLAEPKAVVPKQKFEIENSELCWINGKEQCFTISPFKPELFNTGALKMENETCFIPKSQNIDKTTSFPVSYDGKIISILVIKANADFVMSNDVANKTIILQAVDQKANKYHWQWNPANDLTDSTFKEQSENANIIVPYNVIIEMGKIKFELGTSNNCDDDNKSKILIFDRTRNTFELKPQ